MESTEQPQQNLNRVAGAFLVGMLFGGGVIAVAIYPDLQNSKRNSTFVRNAQGVLVNGCAEMAGPQAPQQ